MKEVLIKIEPDYETKQISTITGFSELTIRKYMREGRIKAYRKGIRKWVVNKTDLNNFLVSIGKKTLDDMVITQKYEGGGVNEIDTLISSYSNTFSILHDYDTNSFYDFEEKGRKIQYKMSYKDTLYYIKILKEILVSKGEASDDFGKEKRESQLESIITKSFSFKYLEDAIANLIYSVLKLSPFIDGNKRIASLLLILLLEKNNFLYTTNGERKIPEDVILFLMVMIEKSQDSEKDIMVKMLINSIRGRR